MTLFFFGPPTLRAGRLAHRLHRHRHGRVVSRSRARDIPSEDGMDFELPEELRLLKDNLRKFVDRELIPLERAVVNDVAQQKELQKKLRPKVEALGLWQYDVPEELGGLGLGMLAKVVVWSEVSRTTALPARHLSLFGFPVSPILYTLEGDAREP